MYTKEQIIEEIRRIAQSKGGKAPSETDFEHFSTIPLTTLRFHLGSWQRAIEEAGLGHSDGKISKKEEPKNDDELLMDLIRLYKDSGEIPSPALIQTKGKFTDRHYRDRWKSVDQAFQIARKKFTGNINPPPPQPLSNIPPLGRSIPLDKTSKEEIKAKYVLDEALQAPISQAPPVPNIPPEPLNSIMNPIETKGDEEMERNNNTKVPNIKFIPQTIKPQKVVKQQGPLDTIDFRGLHFAPITKQGVIFLFGMISEELGFIIESFVSEFPDCEGKRCIDREGNQWERLQIQLEYKSSDFKEHSTDKGFDSRDCDLIICWSHDWPECPFEVLEIQSILKHLT